MGDFSSIQAVTEPFREAERMAMIKVENPVVEFDGDEMTRIEMESVTCRT